MSNVPSTPTQRRFNSWLGGLVLLGLGATLVVTGLLQTTSSHVTASCPAGTELIAKFNFEGHRYVFEKPAGNGGVVTITNGSEKGGDAHSSIPIVATVVKGGPDSLLVTYSPAQTNVHFSNVGLPPVGKGNRPDISNIQFCGGGTPPTTTTTTTTTTTVAPTTSTTTTTTTVPPTTSTTTTTTSTTQPPTTDQSSTTTTSTAASTSTSAPTSTPSSTTSTTLPPGTTTTSVEQEAPVVTSTSLLLASAAASDLPRTGAPSVPLILLGVCLMLMGLTLTILSRASARRSNN